MSALMRARRWALTALATTTLLALATIATHGEASGQAWAAVILVALAAGAWLLADARARMRHAARREATNALTAEEVRW